MPEQAGQVEVLIRGNTDALAGDLQRARGKLDNFDRSVARPTAAMRAFGAANDNAADALRNLSSNITNTQAPLSAVAGRVTFLTTAMKVAGFVVGAAVTAISATAVKAVHAFAELENQQATYNAVLRATGQAAGRTSEDIEGLVRSIRGTSTATEGQVRQAATTLLTFRSVTGDAFDEALRLSQDLAAVGFGSVTSAARMLGRALEDPIQGLTAMRRVGVVFSETQKELIRNLLETGQKVQAQQVILEGLRQQVGGAGAAQGQTLTGAWNQLSNATDNWLERVGRQIVQTLRLSEVVRGLADATDAANAAADRAASPEGRLGAARSELDAYLNARKMQQTPLGLLGSGERMRGQTGEIRDQTETRLRQNVAEAEYAVELDRTARAQDRLAASNSSFEASERTARDAVSGATQQLQRETDQLRMGALAREIDVRLRAATKAAGKELTEEQAASIRQQVTEQFYLKNGASLLSQRVALLGELASAEERDIAKKGELNRAVQEGVRLAPQEIALIRERERVRVGEMQLSDRATLGLVTAQEAARQKTAEFDFATKQYNLTAAQQIGAMNALERKYRDIYEASLIAASKFPEFTAAALDAVNSTKQLDRLAVSSVDRLSAGIASLTDGTKKFGDVMRDVAQSIIRDFIQMIIKATIYRAILGGAGGGGGGGGLLGGFIIPGILHEGGVVGAGAPAGPLMSRAAFAGAPRFARGLDARAPGINEVPILAHRGEVVGWPNQMRERFGGGSAVYVSMTIDLEGANGDETIAAIAGDAAQAAVRVGIENINEYDRRLPVRLREVQVRGA